MTVSRQKLLITGGCGFVGVNLIAYLLASGRYELTVLDDESNWVPENLETIWSAFANSTLHSGIPRPKIITGDVSGNIGNFFQGQDAVVHLAAHTRVVESLQNPKDCYRVNLDGTINVLEACRKEGIRRVVFASSNAAVGESSEPVNEQLPPRPLSPYGATKLAGEGLCSAYAASFGIATVALRFSNAYGPYCQKKGSVVAKFMREIMRDQPLVVYGEGNQTRDFVHVSDLCRVIGMCLDALHEDHPRIQGETFQVATGIETTVLDLVRIISKVTGKTPTLHYEPPRAGEILRNRSNIEKLQRTFGFAPAIPLESGIRSLYDWFLSCSANPVTCNPVAQGA